MNGQGAKASAVLSNSEFTVGVEGWNGGAGVSSASERGITQTRVKVPKYWLNEEGSRNPQTEGL